MALPALSADLLLLHAPAVFDFRNRKDIYFPFLGTSGDVPITPLYEYFPVGFKSLQRYLRERGHRVEILNLSSLFIRYPELSLEDLLDALDVRVIGIDLHWMVHVQGSLAVAERIKRRRRDILTLFGGISTTYYADELIQYPFIDMVMRGYDTLEPMRFLMDELRGSHALDSVPNLLWKDGEGVRENDFSYVPDTFSCGADWSHMPERPSSMTTFPIVEVLSTQNAGCSYNCGWCGGSREAFRRIYPKRRAMARKPPEEIRHEFDTLLTLENLNTYHFYSVGSYNETKQGMHHFLDQVARTNLKSISFEQFHLTSDETLKEMARANRRTSITLSPESHDPRIAKLAGRGVYTNEEMEAWLERALEFGIAQVDIWYFIGMPEQNKASVMETVDYTEHLLHRFKGANVNPMICPMIPFLDPASTFFENPADHGYRVFYRTVEQHRRGMERASIINRTNYETKWMSRGEFLFTGFEAIKRLMEMKMELGFLPRSLVQPYLRKIDDAASFVPIVHAADCLENPAERAKALDELGDEILKRNNEILLHGVANQAFPVNRQIGGRWFDELGWPAAELDEAARPNSSSTGDVTPTSTPASPARA
jgi:clorobiocin/coumermycin A biosynthesis protein CloN6/CouN6